MMIGPDDQFINVLKAKIFLLSQSSDKQNSELNLTMTLAPVWLITNYGSTILISLENEKPGFTEGVNYFLLPLTPEYDIVHYFEKG